MKPALLSVAATMWMALAVPATAGAHMLPVLDLELRAAYVQMRRLQ